MTIKTSSGAITGTKDVLNEIALAFNSAADNYESKGRVYVAEKYKKVAKELYDALDETGYYE